MKTQPYTGRRIFASPIIALLLSSTFAFSQANKTWNGAGADNNWTTPANWNAAVVAGDSLIFGGTTRLAPVNSFAAGTAFAGITFNSGAGAFVLSGNSVSLTGNITDNQPTTVMSIGVPLVPTATPTVNVVTNGTLGISGVISGSSGLTKTGPGRLTLSGANTFSGAVTVAAGTLRLNDNSALGSTSGSTTIANGATLDVSGVVAGTNALDLGLEQVFIVGSGINGQGAIWSNSTQSQSNALQQVIMTGDAAFGGSGPWAESGANPGRWDIRGTPATAVLSTGGQPYSLTKTGANEVRLAGITVDPALADIVVEAGTLGIEGSTTSLGNPATTLTLHPGATLGLLSTFAQLNKKFALIGDGVIASVYNRTGNNTINGLVTLSNDCVFRVVGSNTLTNLGAIGGSGGLIKTGGATNGSSLVLAGTNTYTGKTLVSAGTLALTGTGSISTSATITVAAGATLNANLRTDHTLTLGLGQTLKGDGTIIGNVTVSPVATFAPGTNAIGTLTVNGHLTLNGLALMEISRSTTPATPGSSDLASGIATVTYGGTLTVVNTGSPLQAGDSFTLFEATTRTGSFAVRNLPPLAIGLGWNTSTLAQNGGISVATAGPVPGIVAQPETQTAAPGQTVILSVTATGTPPLSYQWRFNGANIPGATTANYAVTNAQTINDGLYDVVITNASGMATSAAAELKAINFTEGRLICQGGSPLANCTVTVNFWAGGVFRVGGTATTDSAGYFKLQINCAPWAGVQTDRKLIISASCCPNQTWELPNQCCCGDVGTLTCDNCVGEPCDPGTIFWVDTFNGIASSDLDGTNPQAVNNAFASSSGVDVALNPVTGKIYWGDNSTLPGKVMEANRNGSSARVVTTTVAGEWVHHIAVDPGAGAQGTVYWDDFNHLTIRRADIATGVKISIPNLASTLRGIALDLRSTSPNLYYYDGVYVYKADLNGSNAAVLYAIGDGSPGEFAIDTCANRIYVVGATAPHPGVPVPYIRCANLTDGSGLATVLSGYSDVGWSPADIALDLHNRTIYWTSQDNSSQGQVKSAGMDAVNGPADLLVTGTGSEYRGITLCLANNTCPTSFANKDFENNTGLPVDGIEWLIEGAHSNLTFHYDGPYPGALNSTFSSFTIVPSGANTLLRWTGGASIPNGGKAHVGFGIAGSSITTLGAKWLRAGAAAGCVHQISVGEGFSHIGGQVTFHNTATDCETQTLYVGNISLEYFDREVALPDLSVNGVRDPLRTDTLSTAPIPIAPFTSAPVTVALPPDDARFAMVRYTVSASPTLAGPGNTIDYQEVPLLTRPPTTCGTGANRVANGSFESPIVTNNTFTFLSALAGWTTTDSAGKFELWAGSAMGVPSASGNQNLEINANDGDEIVSQVLTVGANCPSTFCFRYTGRYGLPANNTFKVTLSWPGGAPISATLSPASYATGGWKLYSIPFLPTASPVTISFRGIPADQNQGGAHIDDVSVRQQGPTMTCPANITLNIAGTSAPVNFPSPAVTGGTLTGCTPASGSTFPLGTTTVTCTASNGCGSSTCRFTVTVLQVSCPVGTNLVCNGSFEQPLVGANLHNEVLNALTGVPCWTASPSNLTLELWNGTFGAMTPQHLNQHLEINANSGDETVSQVITGLNPGCPANFCFYYAGRFPNPLNNKFEVAVTGSGMPSMIFTPVSYAVGRWQCYAATFMPTASTVTIKFHGIPADGNVGGAHIDNVSLSQQGPIITCPDDITLNITGTSVPVMFPNPTVTGGTLVGCTPARGSAFQLGTTPVTCTAINECGSTTCTFNVTVRRVICPADNGINLVCNGSFEQPPVGANVHNEGLNALTGVPCWTASPSNRTLELWNGTFGAMTPQHLTQHLEINANSGDETVSQVITGLDPNCPATLCFYYTGRYANKLNNRFTVTVSGSGFVPVTLTPEAYSVGGWQYFAATFPSGPNITVQFHGIPADGNDGGAHIDNVTLTQPLAQGPNLVVNGGFETSTPTVLANTSSNTIPPGGVPGWTTSVVGGSNTFEIWANTIAGGWQAAELTHQLEINAQSRDQTVSQEITNLSTTCITTFCFRYTGRFGLVGGTYNNDFTVQLSGGHTAFVVLDPPAFSVGGWKTFCISFVPTSSTVSIAFRGRPHFSDGTTATQGGAHIDDVTLTQNCCAVADADGDGLPVGWEITYGLNPNDASDGARDLDGDGRTNLQEYNEGTNPTDPNSHLILVPGGIGAGGLVIHLDAAANHSYTVERSPSLTGASWTTVATVPAEPVARTVDLTVPPDTQTRGFFRVTTP